MPPDVVELVASGRGAQDLQRQDPARRPRASCTGGRARAPRADRHATRARAAVAWRRGPRPSRARARRAARASTLGTWRRSSAGPVRGLVAGWRCSWPGRAAAIRCGGRSPRACSRGWPASACRIEGLEQLLGPGPLVIASNHASYVDVPVLMAALPRTSCFVAKKEVLALAARRAVRAQGRAPDRWTASTCSRAWRTPAGSARRSRAATRCCSSPRARSRRRPGCGRSAWARSRPRRRRAPVVPIAIAGTRRCCARARRHGPAPSRIWIGAPVRAEGEGWRAVVSLRDRVAEQIAAHCGEPRLDLVAGRAAVAHERVRLGCRPTTSAPAEAVIRPYLPPTPLRRSFAVPGRGDVLLKLECWQPTGSFKVRGALANLLRAHARGAAARGIVAASAGNHALGRRVRRAGAGRATCGRRCSCRRPRRGEGREAAHVPGRGAEHGATYDDAHALALAERRRPGPRTSTHSTIPRTAAGQGTVGLEMLASGRTCGTIVVPVGGGGLIACMAASPQVERSRRAHRRACSRRPRPPYRESLRRGEALLEYPAGRRWRTGSRAASARSCSRTAPRGRGRGGLPRPRSRTRWSRSWRATRWSPRPRARSASPRCARARCRATTGRPVAVVVTGGNMDASVLARLLRDRA